MRRKAQGRKCAHCGATFTGTHTRAECFKAQAVRWGFSKEVRHA